jgi:hypothetical protein
MAKRYRDGDDVEVVYVERKKKGCLSGCFGLFAVLCLLMLVGFVAFMIPAFRAAREAAERERARRAQGGAPAPPPSAPIPPAIVSTGAAPLPSSPSASVKDQAGGFRVGDEVELTGLTLTSSRQIFEEKNAPGGPTRRFLLGKEIFGVKVAERARIVGIDSGVLQVELLSGNWKGRTGWISPGDVRRPATEDELAGDVVDGRPQSLRREIYAEIYRAGSRATKEANQRIPIEPDADQARFNRRFAEHQALYEKLMKQGRMALVKKYNADGATLDRIDKEGAERKWPLPDLD